ncbi:MAG: chemotaxis protein CheW [Acidobacteriota bacterium]
MLDLFIYETMQLLDELEQSIIDSEKNGGISSCINEIFRIMHTVKGSAAMMMLDGIAALAHALEDLYFYLREENPLVESYSEITDLSLQVVDFIKTEINKLETGQMVDGDGSKLIDSIKGYLSSLKSSNGNDDFSSNKNRPQVKPSFYISSDRNETTNDLSGHWFSATIHFEDGCGMENVRAFLIIHNLKEIASEVRCIPEDIVDNDENVELIRNQGFVVQFKTNIQRDEAESLLMKTAFVRDVLIDEACPDPAVELLEKQEKPRIILDENEESETSGQEKFALQHADALNKKQTMISVNVSKLDMLMDLVGELVIAEAMVTQHPELANLELDNFRKAARQLGKITHDLQDTVMSIRMVPLANTFQKMNRLVRDMSKKIGKEVKLIIRGEETEVDKNIIEHISDPLMHLIRNCIDHGLETPQERLINGKPESGTIILEAKNAGGDVWINVKDDGKGLDTTRILEKAKERGLTSKTENDLTDREIYSFIMMPGFSTKDGVSEFSGRGVGMDVVAQNIEGIGGNVLIDSEINSGTTVSLKLPLTLAIIDGMTISVGKSKFTVPITSIRESFRTQENELIIDPDGNEAIMVRGECYPVIRLSRLYSINTDVVHICSGIIMMCEYENKKICLFADTLIGEQQVVIKPLPEFIKRARGKTRGLAGCTLLGDGSISLILDVAGLAGSQIH